MSNAQHDRTAGQGAPSGDWWTRRPRRSVNDRKIAGVAGGLGRRFGVDPVLLRVGFVILALFGLGVFLYLLSWLLLPADGDEVSAAEALIGKGESSTSPVLTVGLAIGAAISFGWMPFWGGLPIFPLVIAGVITVIVLRNKAKGGGCAGRSAKSNSADQGVDTPPWADRLGQQADSWGAKAESWGAQAEQWVARQPWSSGLDGTKRPGSKSKDQSSPFEQPAFWDDAASSNQHSGPRANPRVNLTKDAPAEGQSSSPSEPTPPAWDPLGVAPFAWDLPEPSPLPPPAPAPRDRGVVGRVTMGAVLLIGGLATAGTLLGWWQLSWAGVAATGLLVLAVGLLVGSLSGGRGKSLIGPGIFLSLVTLALTITGIRGTEGYGQQTWTPTVATLSSQYELNGGQGELDLRKLTVPAGQTVTTELEVRAGQASVIVPEEMNLDVTCSTNAGQVDCLGIVDEGLRSEISNTQDGSSDQGRVKLTVHTGAGQAEVRNG
jgi:phage shock protein PspC (stress-responsive transcriptional regulator)